VMIQEVEGFKNSSRFVLLLLTTQDKTDLCRYPVTRVPGLHIPEKRQNKDLKNKFQALVSMWLSGQVNE